MLRRHAAASILLTLLLAPPAAAQLPAHWRDELASPTHPLTLPMFDPDTVRWPASPLSPPPHPVRALYVNAWAFGGMRLEQLLDLAAGTEVNSFVIDVKDDTGYLTYRSEVPTARAIGANTQLRARDVRVRLARLQARGIHPIARIVVAKDPLLAARKPEWAIRHTGRRPVARPEGLRLGRRLPGLGVDLRRPARSGSGVARLRRDPVRLRALSR